MADAKAEAFKSLRGLEWGSPRRYLKFLQFVVTYKYEILLAVSSLLYIIVFSYFLALKHYVFETYAWDLGSFSQALYTTLYSGKFLYQTVYLFVLPSGDYFGIHWSPILLLLLPVYAIWPSPLTLLIVKTIAIGVAAIPLYLLGVKLLKNKMLALTVSLLYLLYPALQAANWFDFQPQSFLPLLIFVMQYAFITRRWKLYIIASLLGSMTMEFGALVTALLAFLNWIMMLLTKEYLYNGTIGLKKTLLSRANVYALLAIVITISLFLVGSFIVNSHEYTPEFEGFLRAYGNWRILGQKVDTLSLPIYVLMHPWKAYEALLYDYHIKFLYIIILFGSLGFLPLRSVYSVVALLLLAPFLLSNYRAYYTIGAHYPLYLIPVIFIGLIYSLRSLMNANNAKSISKILLVIMMFFTVSLSPLSPMSYMFVKDIGMLWYPLPPWENTDYRAISSLHKLISLIPSNASVLTQNHVFPHVSNRPDAYVIPLESLYFYNTSAAQKYIQYLLNNSEFVVIDFKNGYDIPSEYTLKLALHAGFNIYAFGDSAVLLKRNYTGKPLFEENIEYRTFYAREMSLGRNTQLIFDKEVKRDTAYLGKGIEGYVVYGPYTYLPSGVYRITFIVKCENIESDAPILEVDVSANRGREILARRTVFGFEVKNGAWSKITLIVSSADKLRPLVEFRVFSFGNSDVFFDRVVIERLSSNTTVNFGTTTFTYKELILKSGSIVNGMLYHPCCLEDETFWYGPYVSLPPGNYTALFLVKILPSPKNNEKILTLDIAYDRGREVLAKLELNVSSLEEVDTGWYKALLHFTLDKEVKDVEFRGLNPSPNYEIYLAYILIGMNENNL